jgi:hypothetical protein
VGLAGQCRQCADAYLCAIHRMFEPHAA